MRQSRKIISILIIIVIPFFTGCDSDNDSTYSIEIYPSFGAVGSTVELRGLNFNTDVTKNIVEFNGVRAEILYASAHALVAVVPNTTTGEVNITIGNKVFKKDEPFQIIEAKGSWATKSNFPGECRYYGALCIAYGNAGFIGLGANKEGMELNDLWKYEQSSDTWTQLKSFPGAVSLVLTTFAIKNKLYAITQELRFNDETSKSYFPLWEYNIETDEWHEDVRFFDVSNGYVSATYNDEIAVIGIKEYGLYGFYDFDPEGVESITVLPPDERGFNLFESVQGNPPSIYLVSSGESSFGGYYLRFIRYDFEQDKWIAYKDFNNGYARYISTTARNIFFKLQDNFFIGSDKYVDGVPLNNIWHYSEKTNEWTLTKPSPFPGIGRNVFVIGNKAYFIPCGKETESVNTLIEFDPEL